MIDGMEKRENERALDCTKRISCLEEITIRPVNRWVTNVEIRKKEEKTSVEKESKEKRKNPPWEHRKSLFR